MNQIPFIGAFESTYQPAFDIDVFETTKHAVRWREDLRLLRACGVERCRYPVRWHRVEREPGIFDWTETALVFEHMRELGLVPIVDLVHHTSYPAWLDGFHDPRFRASFVRYVTACARRFPWIEAYTVFNEPFSTLMLCGHEGVWPPYERGIEGFVAVARNVIPAASEASRRCRELLPDAQHVHVEVCEHATADGTDEAEEFAAYANDRRFFVTDALLGRPLARDRPFVSEVVAAGGSDLLELEAGHIDVLGLDYYAHNQWHWTGRHRGAPLSPIPIPFSDLISEYSSRYDVPLIVGETNIRGFASDRATWLKYTLEQCELARADGVPLEGYCWFPFIDSCDWSSVLCLSESAVDPVGAFWLDDSLERRSSSMSTSYALAAAGAPSTALPAYVLQPPVADCLSGWAPHMSHWDWEEPPATEIDDTTLVGAA